MKVIVLLLVSLFCIPVYAKDVRVESKTAIYQTSSKKSKIITYVSSNDKLKVIESKDVWLKVITPIGKTGFIHKDSLKKTDDSGAGELLVSMIIFFIIFCYIIKYIWKRRCPSCRKWWARKIYDNDLISSDEFYKTKTVIEKHYDKSRNLTGTTERPVQVHMVRNKWRRYCRCKRCNHEWTFVDVVEYEG